MNEFGTLEEILNGYCSKAAPSKTNQTAEYKELRLSERNPYMLMLDFVNVEILDYEAFLEALRD